MRWRVAFAAVFCLVSGFVWTGAAVARGAVAQEPEASFVGRIGDERAAAGLGGLSVSQELVDVARRHAQEMADQQRLYHNDRLASDVPNWQKVGENVGVGSSVEEIHQAFMASSSHRDNILDADFTEVGVGVVADGPDLWVVEVFRLPKPAPEAAPQPAPTSQPAQASSSEPPSNRAGSGRSGSGGVRAASSTSPSPPPPSGGTSPAPAALASAPAPAAPVPPASTTTTTSAPLAEISASVAALAEPAATPASTTVPAASALRHSSARVATLQPATARRVTLPVGMAAALLVLVVAGLVWQVASERARLAAGARRPSVVDVWELALAA